MSETAFEKWWLSIPLDVRKHGPSMFDVRNAWNAAIDAAIAACREVTEWDDQCTAGAKECDTLIQKLRSE